MGTVEQDEVEELLRKLLAREFEHAALSRRHIEMILEALQKRDRIIDELKAKP